MIIKRKYVASVSRRGKNSQSRCAKQGSRGPTAFVYGGEGPKSMFLGKGASQGQFFFYGRGRVSKSIFAKLKKTLSCFPTVFNFLLGWEGG